MPKPIIEIKNLSKRYSIGRRASYGSLREEIMQALASPFRMKTAAEDSDSTVWALRDVSFSVEEGEVLGIIGRNGAGKSTLLKILSRITEPTEGRVVMRGRVASLLEVGTGFHPELTGRENIFLNGALLGMTSSEIRRKFDEIVAFSEIEKFLDTPVKRYSSGMYVRLAFAVAAHLEPEILVIDEVLAVGDAAFQKKCLGKMGEVAKGGRTVLFVSHNMAAVESLCQKAIFLSKGRLVKEGEANAIVGEYLINTEVEKVEVQLSDRKDRIGKGGGKLTRIKIKPLNDESRAIRCSDRIRIKVDYAGDKNLNDYAIVLAILNQMGTPIYWLDSRYDAELPVSISNKGTISCVTAPLGLVPGVYYVNAALIVNNEVVDQIESATSFAVESVDFYGVGRLPTHRHGVCLLAQKWYVD